MDFPLCVLAFRLWYSSLWSLCLRLRTLDLGLWAFWISDSRTFVLGILDSDSGIWALDCGLWVLDLKLWALDFGFRLLDSN